MYIQKTICQIFTNGRLYQKDRELTLGVLDDAETSKHIYFSSVVAASEPWKVEEQPLTMFIVISIIVDFEIRTR